MRKFSRRKLAVALIAGFFLSNLHATGAGLQIEAENPINLVNSFYKIECLGTIKSDRFPLVFGAGLNVEKHRDDKFCGLNVLLDFPFLQKQLKNNFHLFFGAGLSFDALSSKSCGFAFDFGARLFCGLSWYFFADSFEIYFQQNVAPAGRYEIESANLKFVPKFPVDVGVRWHF